MTKIVLCLSYSLVYTNCTKLELKFKSMCDIIKFGIRLTARTGVTNILVYRITKVYHKSIYIKFVHIPQALYSYYYFVDLPFWYVYVRLIII